MILGLALEEIVVGERQHCKVPKDYQERNLEERKEDQKRNDVMIGMSPTPQMNSIKEDNRESGHQGDGNDLEKMVLQEFQQVHS